MELRQMRYFLAVVDHGGITRAARDLYISQPSLSQAIRNLENQFQTPLFERSGRELKTTAAGLALADTLRKVLEIADDGAERVRRVAALESGRLTIATASTLAIYPLAEWVSVFLDEHPGIEIHILEHGTTSQVVAALRRGAADIALLEPPVVEPSVISRTWRTEELLIAGSVAPLDQFEETVPASVVGEIPFGIVSREEGGHTPSLTEISSLLRDIRVTSSDRLLLWELVAAGVVATFVPAEVAAIVIPEVPLRRVDPPVTREIAVAFRSGHPAAAVGAFLSMVFGDPRAPRTDSIKAKATSDTVAVS